MAASGEVIAQDGGQGNIKLHPYLVTLVRWCVSCLWRSATVLLQRLMTTPLQPITGPAPPRARAPPRAPGTEHLHPEPRVECQLLHQPDTHTMDVIFVHGLYGSLGNTWRQGDWRQKYLSEPKIVTLRDHSKPNTCKCHENRNKNQTTTDNLPEDIKASTNTYTNHMHNDNKYDIGNSTDFNDQEMSIKNINEKLSKKVIPEENDLITEQFYNNTLVDQVDNDNYDTQANFVHDLFTKETNCDKCCENNAIKYNEDNRIKCDPQNDNDMKWEYNSSKYNENNRNKCKPQSDYDIKCEYSSKYNPDNNFKCDDRQNLKHIYNENDKFKCKNDFKCHQDDENGKDNDFKCEYSEVNDFNECKCAEAKSCEVGCGCVCNDCYSSCWPRDWIKMDFPGARVISINYTSDPYLWRPLWIKENKRLNLYQRAEQMIEQLLAMGVGEKPIVWVGHSKGGLFIKQIYCEAYEAYQKINKDPRTSDETKETKKVFSQQIDNNSSETNEITSENIDTIIGHFKQSEDKETRDIRQNNNYTVQNGSYTEVNDNYAVHNDNTTKHYDNYTEENYNYTIYTDNNTKQDDRYTIENDNYSETNDNRTNTDDISPREIDNHRIENNNFRLKQSVNNNNLCAIDDIVEYKNKNIVFEDVSAKNNDLEYIKVTDVNIRNVRIENGGGEDAKLGDANGNEDLTSSIEDGVLRARSALWSRSRGFMFYSVPHRGSPLADIKTPVTARSVDLLEIAKDCPLVVDLQSRWELAVGPRAPTVRGVVETCRTLMAVLRLTIVSAESADAGCGVLSGISVDHREICKPSSRSCRLYTMLKDVITDATSCHCQ